MQKFIVLIILLIVAISSQSFYQNTPLAASIKNGQSVYATYCMSCHMEDGNGVEGAFPSLVKTNHLNDKNKLVKIILQGMRGQTVVNGITYNGEMAGLNLTDQEVADVINFIRNSWGNKATAMKITEVAPAKKSVVKGYQAF